MMNPFDLYNTRKHTTFTSIWPYTLPHRVDTYHKAHRADKSRLIEAVRGMSQSTIQAIGIGPDGLSIWTRQLPMHAQQDAIFTRADCLLRYGTFASERAAELVSAIPNSPSSEEHCGRHGMAPLASRAQWKARRIKGQRRVLRIEVRETILGS
ncbi:hypothetical protein Vi05172_g12852 [Venturia inaequalis]|nr:hypothetical protein Vi05172_g12852 [Venturia inaequalis]